MLNLANHKIDFDLNAAWTFSATGHEKGAGDGVGAFLKSTAKRATLSKDVHLSFPKDFYDFLKKQIQLCICSISKLVKSKKLKAVS
jgi:hypothetical protein